MKTCACMNTHGAHSLFHVTLLYSSQQITSWNSSLLIYLNNNDIPGIKWHRLISLSFLLLLQPPTMLLEEQIPYKVASLTNTPRCFHCETVDCDRSLKMADLFIFYILYTLLSLSGNSGRLYLGKTTAAERAALPRPTGACWVFLCFRNPPDSDMDYRIFNVITWSFWCVRIHTGVWHTDNESAQHIWLWKTITIFVYCLNLGS